MFGILVQTHQKQWCQTFEFFTISIFARSGRSSNQFLLSIIIDMIIDQSAYILAIAHQLILTVVVFKNKMKYLTDLSNLLIVKN